MAERFDFKFTKQGPSQDEQNRARLINSISEMRTALEKTRKKDPSASEPNVGIDIQELEGTIKEYESVLANLEIAIRSRGLASLGVQMLQLEQDLSALDKAIKRNAEEQSELRGRSPVDEGGVQRLRQKAIEFNSKRQQLLTQMRDCDKRRAQLLLGTSSEQG